MVYGVIVSSMKASWINEQSLLVLGLMCGFYIMMFVFVGYTWLSMVLLGSNALICLAIYWLTLGSFGELRLLKKKETKKK